MEVYLRLFKNQQLFIFNATKFFLFLLSVYVMLSSKINVYSAPLPSPPYDSIEISEVFDTNNASGVGSLVHSNKALKITDAPHQLTSIWSKNKLDFSKNWKLDSYIYFGMSFKDAADGMTLTFQSDSTKVLGTRGGGLGAYQGNISDNAFSIEFDTDVNRNSYDKEVSTNSGYFGQHIAFVDHTNSYENLNFKYLLESSFPYGLSDGEWKKLTIEWNSSTKIIKYVLSKMNGVLLRDGTYPVDPDRFPDKKAYWGFTGSTGSNFQTNGVSFLSVPQSQIQESFLSNEEATEGDIIELKINQTIVAGSWDNRKLIIDLTEFGFDDLTFVEDSLFIDGKLTAPNKVKDGTIEIIDLPDLSMYDTFESVISLKLQVHQYSKPKKISIIGSGVDEQSMEVRKINEVSLTVNKNPLYAEPNQQLMVLGNDSSLNNYNSFVKNVMFEGELLENNEFTTELINNLSLDTIGSRIASIRVTLKSEMLKYIDIKVPVTVVWGNVIRIKGFENQTISGLSLNKKEDKFNLKATRGIETDNKNSTINPNFPNSYISIGIYNRPEGVIGLPNGNFEFNGTNSILDVVKNIPVQTVDVGDIVKIKHHEVLEFHDRINVYNDSKEQIPYKENELISNESFYEITNKGYRLLFFNQLSVRESEIPIYSSNDYLDSNVSNFIEKNDYESVRIKRFSEYPDTNTAGKKEAKVRIEEKLLNGKIIEYDYKVFVNVGKGEIKLTVPDRIIYNDFSKNQEEQIIQRKETSITDLVLTDNRGSNIQGDWKITVKVDRNDLGAAPYLIYRENGKSDHFLDNGEVIIYNQEKQKESQEPLTVNLSEKWTSNSGILLKIPSKNNLKIKKYSETLIWNILEGP